MTENHRIGRLSDVFCLAFRAFGGLTESGDERAMLGVLFGQGEVLVIVIVIAVLVFILVRRKR